MFFLRINDILYRVKSNLVMTKYVVGDNMIKEYRIKRGFTQEQLAGIINLSTRQLQRIEKDERNTSISTLIKIINILNIPDDEVVKIFKKTPIHL